MNDIDALGCLRLGPSRSGRLGLGNRTVVLGALHLLEQTRSLQGQTRLSPPVSEAPDLGACPLPHTRGRGRVGPPLGGEATQSNHTSTTQVRRISRRNSFDSVRLLVLNRPCAPVRRGGPHV